LDPLQDRGGIFVRSGVGAAEKSIGLRPSCAVEYPGIVEINKPGEPPNKTTFWLAASGHPDTGTIQRRIGGKKLPGLRKFAVAYF
jgi:hypothetical protein